MSVVRLSFHQFLQGRHELVDDLVLAVSDIVRHARADMIRKQLLIEGVERRAHRADLDQNIRAISVVFHHTADSADLSLNAIQTVDEFFIFVIRSLLRFMGTATFLIHVITTFLFILYTPSGYLSRKRDKIFFQKRLVFSSKKVYNERTIKQRGA